MSKLDLCHCHLAKFCMAAYVCWVGEIARVSCRGPSHMVIQGILPIFILWQKGMIPPNKYIFFKSILCSVFKTCTGRCVCFFHKTNHVLLLWLHLAAEKKRIRIPELHLLTEKRIWLLCLKGLFHSFFQLMIPVSKRNPCGCGTSAHMGSASLLPIPSSVAK